MAGGGNRIYSSNTGKNLAMKKIITVLLLVLAFQKIGIAQNSDYLDSFENSPSEALAWAYDIVCNGYEIGGGSIRIHNADVQQRVFSLLGISPDQAAEKFGFLLDAFEYGPPPHGGIAFGWDRICMLLSGATSLRDVIAFPKTGAGFDPLTSAPTPITDQQRLEAGIDADPFALDASDD